MEADVALLGRYATGRDADAFAELVRRYAGMVYAVARRVTGSAAEAEDVCQACFLELARRAGSVSGSVGGWLHTAAIRRAANAARDRATRARHERAAAAPERSSPDTSRAEFEALTAHVDAALADLPDDLRVPLVEHYLAGRTQADVAVGLGVNPSTVSRRLRDGVDRLRDTLTARGVTAPAVALPAALAAGTTEAAPPTLVASLNKLALSGVGPPAAGAAVAIAKPVLVAFALLAVIAAAVALVSQLRPAAPIPRVNFAQLTRVEDRMKMTVETVPAVAVLYSSRRTTFARMGELGDVTTPLLAAARAAGLERAGPLTYVHRGVVDGQADAEFTLEIALPVRGEPRDAVPAPFAVKTLPATRCAVVRYVGPMPTTPGWRLLDRESAAAGHTPTGEIREVYERFVAPGSPENVTVLQRAIAGERPTGRYSMPSMSVDDLDEGVAFVRDKLGWDVAYRDADFVTFTFGAAAMGVGRRRPPFDGPVSFYVAVTHVDAYHAELKARGVTTLGDPPADTVYGMREFGVMAPSGNRITFGQPLASDEDPPADDGPAPDTAPAHHVENTIPVLAVVDLSESIRYYVDVLGFRQDWATPDVASVARDGHAIMLQRRAATAPGCVWVGVQDVRPLYEALVDRGVHIVQPPTNQPHALEFRAADPDGNILWFGSGPLIGVPFGRQPDWVREDE